MSSLPADSAQKPSGRRLRGRALSPRAVKRLIVAGQRWRDRDDYWTVIRVWRKDAVCLIERHGDGARRTVRFAELGLAYRPELEA